MARRLLNTIQAILDKLPEGILSPALLLTLRPSPHPTRGSNTAEPARDACSIGFILNINQDKKGRKRTAGVRNWSTSRVTFVLQKLAYKYVLKHFFCDWANILTIESRGGDILRIIYIGSRLFFALSDTICLYYQT